jgi:hypothetical protein
VHQRPTQRDGERRPLGIPGVLNRLDPRKTNCIQWPRWRGIPSFSGALQYGTISALPFTVEVALIEASVVSTAPLSRSFASTFRARDVGLGPLLTELTRVAWDTEDADVEVEHRQVGTVPSDIWVSESGLLLYATPQGSS